MRVRVFTLVQCILIKVTNEYCQQPKKPIRTVSEWMGESVSVRENDNERKKETDSGIGENKPIKRKLQ